MHAHISGIDVVICVWLFTFSHRFINAVLQSHYWLQLRIPWLTYSFLAIILHQGFKNCWSTNVLLQDGLWFNKISVPPGAPSMTFNHLPYSKKWASYAKNDELEQSSVPLEYRLPYTKGSGLFLFEATLCQIVSKQYGCGRMRKVTSFLISVGDPWKNRSCTSCYEMLC